MVLSHIHRLTSFHLHKEKFLKKIYNYNENAVGRWNNVRQLVKITKETGMFSYI